MDPNKHMKNQCSQSYYIIDINPHRWNHSNQTDLVALHILHPFVSKTMQTYTAILLWEHYMKVMGNKHMV